jgi:glycosyltransferase involved in cell wall biosynthesis
MSRAHDVAIYSPFASIYYGRVEKQGGGAELQTTLLARRLAERGLRVAHIVYPVREPQPLEPPAPTLIERAAWRGDGSAGRLAEARAVWDGFRAADAAVYIVRGSGGHLIAAAAYCGIARRRLVFSTSNDLDFDFERPDRYRSVLRGYRYSIRRANRVVVQTRQQVQLAQATLPGLDPTLIPSFAQPAEPARAEPRYFLWADRLVEYKQPERYLELAEALPDLQFRMVAAPTSETPAELADSIRAEAERLPNLELVAPRPRDQLLRELKTAVAVVTTSRAEGMPNTFLEAWARGIPVLSLALDPDARIADNEIGIVANGSMEAMVRGAKALWTDHEMRAAMGARAREFVRSVHSPEAVTERWYRLLQELVDQ